MRGQIESLLDQGTKAARVGEIKRARETFIRVIELDQRNEMAWLWLSTVVETPADKSVCLENVLVINPDNKHALEGLRYLRQHGGDEMSQSALLPRLTGPRLWSELEWGAPGVEVSPPPAERLCPRCGFRNSGWAYVCDRCGADLQPVNLYVAVSRPRQRGFTSLLKAWGAAFVFNRRWAFLPEIELASWGRSLAALGMAALFTSAWRVIMTVVLRLLVTQYDARGQLPADALRCVVHVLLLTPLLALACTPVALLTWVGARLLGGRRDLKTHAHLTAVAFSAWVVLVALLAPLATLVPYLLGGRVRGATRLRLYLRLLSEGMPVFVGVAAGVTGFVWLVQALRTAHHLSATRAILVALAVVALGASLFLGLDRFIGGRLTALVSVLVTTFFLPLLD